MQYSSPIHSSSIHFFHGWWRALCFESFWRPKKSPIFYSKSLVTAVACNCSWLHQLCVTQRTRPVCATQCWIEQKKIPCNSNLRLNLTESATKELCCWLISVSAWHVLWPPSFKSTLMGHISQQNGSKWCLSQTLFQRWAQQGFSNTCSNMGHFFLPLSLRAGTSLDQALKRSASGTCDKQKRETFQRMNRRRWRQIPEHSSVYWPRRVQYFHQRVRVRPELN